MDGNFTKVHVTIVQKAMKVILSQHDGNNISLIKMIKKLLEFGSRRWNLEEQRFQNKKS